MTYNDERGENVPVDIEYLEERVEDAAQSAHNAHFGDAAEAHSFAFSAEEGHFPLDEEDE